MSDQIASFLRTVLKLAGGWLIAKGWADQPGVESLIGGILAAVGIAWSYFHHAPPAVPEK